MKKQFLTYIVIVFCFSFLLKAQEVSTSVLNKVALKSSQKVVFLDLRGSFKEFTEDAILLTQEADGFVIELQKTLLGKAKNKKIKNSVPQKVSNIELQGRETISRIKLVTNQNIEISNISIKKRKVIISLNLTESAIIETEIIETPDSTQTFATTKGSATSDAALVRGDNIQSGFIEGGITISKVYKKPERLNVTILHNRSTKRKAYSLSSILLKSKKSRIERSLDLKLNVVSITQMPMENYGRNVIYFKADHYLSAIYLSDLLKEVYVIMPFTSETKKKEVDVEILIIE